MHRDKAGGEQLFEQYYSSVYGQRWDGLKQALCQETAPVCPDGPLASPYYMDRASIAAASLLPVSPGQSVLDMCAAPGGKTLILAMKLNGEGLLVANDRSSDRRGRLHNVVGSCLGPELSRTVKITGHDSTRWGLHERSVYDCVLLDAPCSSERHVIKDPVVLRQWSPSRPRRLSIQQFAMLSSALLAVKPGGYILYSTCSICPAENQEVIEKLISRHPEEVREIALADDDARGSEQLGHGRIFLPDNGQNMGPLYFCLLRRTE